MTTLSPIGTPGPARSFAAKTAAAKGRVTELSVMATPGRIHSFTAKASAAPPEVWDLNEFLWETLDMIAFREEEINLYASIRDADGAAPAVITNVQMAIYQDAREIAKFTSMLSAEGTRYYHNWTVPNNLDYGKYYAVVTATVDGTAWEKVIAVIDVRENTERLMKDIYLRILNKQVI